MKKVFALIAAVVMTVGILSGCSSKKKVENNVEINAVMLKGPTGIGAVELMEKSENGKAKGNYNISVAAAPDEIVGKILNGEADIAAVPTNLASVLYNKTEGDVTVIAVNTLGVLYVLDKGESVNSISDLSGKTIYSSGKGAVPEYILNYILEKNGVTDTNVIYNTEHAETASAISAGETEIAVLPEPNVTAVTMKDKDIKIALDLTEEWNKINDENMAMGCVIVRNEFLNENEEAVKQFIDEYSESIEYVNSNVVEAAQLVEKYEIMGSATAAEKAIPNCNICFITGEEMKDMLESFYNVLFEAEPKSVGGKLPNAEFYYTEK